MCIILLAILNVSAGNAFQQSSCEASTCSKGRIEELESVIIQDHGHEIIDQIRTSPELYIEDEVEAFAQLANILIDVEVSTLTKRDLFVSFKTMQRRIQQIEKEFVSLYERIRHKNTTNIDFPGCTNASNASAIIFVSQQTGVIRTDNEVNDVQSQTKQALENVMEVIGERSVIFKKATILLTDKEDHTAVTNAYENWFNWKNRALPALSVYYVSQLEDDDTKVAIDVIVEEEGTQS